MGYKREVHGKEKTMEAISAQKEGEEKRTWRR